MKRQETRLKIVYSTRVMIAARNRVNQHFIRMRISTTWFDVIDIRRKSVTERQRSCFIQNYNRVSWRIVK